MAETKLTKLQTVVGTMVLLIVVALAVYAGDSAPVIGLKPFAVGFGVLVGCWIVFGLLAASFEKGVAIWKRPISLIISLIIVAICILPVVAWCIVPLQFAGRFSPLLSAVESPEKPPMFPSDNPPDHIEGKVLPIRITETDKWIDATILNLLPERVKPVQISDVGTVAWLTCETRRTGDYVDKSGRSHGTASSRDCLLRFMRLKDSWGLGQKLFYGVPPSSSISGSETGSIPYREIAEFLGSLPQR